jgi:hypothetical protein
MIHSKLYKLLVAFLGLIGVALFVASCQQQTDVLPEDTDAKLKQVEQKLKQIALIMTEVSRNPEIKEMIGQGVATGYYHDERILLQDLWNPEESKALKNYAKSSSNLSVFRETFQSVYRKGKYPQADQFFGQSNKSTDELINYILSNPVSIYTPYSDASNRQNKSFTEGEVTISFNTAEEQDSNIGYLLNDGETVGEVLVDDSYMSQNVTYIISQEGFEDGTGFDEDGTYIPELPGGGSTGGGVVIPSSLYPSPNQPKPDIYLPNKPSYPDLPDNPKVHVVKIAEVQLTKQLDPSFGLKNSGGSEVRLVRAQAFLSNVGGNPTANPNDLIKELFFTRAAINEQRWVGANLIVDTDWKLAEQQHYFGSYEEDNGSDKIKLSGKVKFRLFDLVDVELGADYEKEFGSKNERLFNLDIDRTFYFINNNSPFAFPEVRNGWGVYSDKDYFKFTMPYFVIE